MASLTLRSAGSILTHAQLDANFTNLNVGVCNTVVVVTGTTQTAVAGTLYVLTNAAATTVTLPASATAGHTVKVSVANGLATNVIARNGLNINSLAENMTINSTHVTVVLVYIDATRGWWVGSS